MSVSLAIDSAEFKAYNAEIEDITNKAANDNKMGFFKCLPDLDL